MKKSLFLISILTGLFVCQACQRKGCTDPLASNYDKKATKAKNSECEYGTEEFPCGEGIEFCALFNQNAISGNVDISENAEGGTVVKWENTASGNYQVLEIIFYGTNEQVYTCSNSQQAGTFTANYFSDLSGSLTCIDGQFNLTKYSIANGLSAQLNLNFSDSSTLTNGHFYKAK